MKSTNRRHLVATIFPVSLLDTVRRQSQMQSGSNADEIVILTGSQSAQSRHMRLIAEEFARAGKTIRVVRSLRTIEE